VRKLAIAATALLVGAISLTTREASADEYAARHVSRYVDRSAYAYQPLYHPVYAEPWSAGPRFSYDYAYGPGYDTAYPRRYARTYVAPVAVTRVRRVVRSYGYEPGYFADLSISRAYLPSYGPYLPSYGAWNRPAVSFGLGFGGPYWPW
jgi:hypothetical protein